MKKILMGTSALALLGVSAGQAEAAEWDLDWGGYYNSAVIYRASDGLSDNNPEEEGIDVVQDGEIHFKPSITLDNGLTFGAIVEIEADPTAGQTIDDSHVFVSGSFGRLDIGSESGAASKMHYGAPNVGWFGAADGGDVAGYLDIDNLNFGRSPFFAGAANRVSYYTPRFAGFQVGASYAHDDNQNKNSPTAATFENIFDIGANYVNSFGALDLAIGAVYSTAERRAGAPTVAQNGTFITVNPVTGAITQTAFAAGAAIPAGALVVTPAVAAAPGAPGGDPDMFGVGATIGYAGFVIGGNYTQQDEDNGLDDRDYYDLGVAYTTGPWGVSLQWAHSEQGNQDENHYLGAVTYDLGPGVTAGVYAGFSEADYGPGNDPDGFLVGTGFALSF